MKANLCSSIFSATALSLALNACSVHVGPDDGAASLADITHAQAKGAINGASWKINGGTAAITKDSSGRPLLTMTLSHRTSGCGDVPTFQDGAVFINTPAATGTYGFPTGTVVFSYAQGGHPQNDLAGGSTVIVDSISTSEVSGRVNAAFDRSSISGSFTLPICSSTVSTPAPAPPPPAATVDIVKVLASWGHSWRGTENVSTPGKYGELSFYFNMDKAPRDASPVTFQMGGVCSYAEMGKGGVGLYWTSDVNGAYLSADNTGRVYLNCGRRNKYEIGSISETAIHVDSIGCNEIMHKVPVNPNSLTVTLAGTNLANASKYFPATPAVSPRFPATPAITCRGQIKRN